MYNVFHTSGQQESEAFFKTWLIALERRKNPLAVFPAFPFHFGFKENSGSKAQPQKGVNHYKNTKRRFGVNSDLESAFPLS